MFGFKPGGAKPGGRQNTPSVSDGTAGGDHRLASLQDLSRSFRDGARGIEDHYKELFSAIDTTSDTNVFISDTRDTLNEQLDKLSPEQPLYGIPFAVKDNVLTRLAPTSNGTRALQNWNPGIDAAIIARLCSFGGIMVGKTNLPEFCQHMSCANAIYGAARNPHGDNLFPGGSSSGSAAAVAGGLVPLAIGTDTGGSVRIPAALTGCYGFRPTTGRYPTDGLTPVTGAADTPGLITRSVRDIAFLDQLIIGDAASPVATEPPGKIRIGVPGAYFYENLDPGVSQAVEQTLRKLKSAGVQLIEIDMAGIGELAPQVGFPIAFYDMTRELARFFTQHPIDMPLSALLAELDGTVERAAIEAQLGEEAIPYETYLHALSVERPRLIALYEDYFTANRLDAFIVPTTIAPAHTHTGNGPDAEIEHNGTRVPTFPTYIHNTEPTSFAGAPAVTLPCGVTPDGAPVGVELVGRSGDDRQLLTIASHVDSTIDGVPHSFYERI